MFELIIIIVAFIFLSGLMAMIDAAVLSVTQAEVEVMVNRGKWGSKSLKIVVSRITRAVVVIVLFTNTINVLGPILAGKKAVELYGSAVIGIVTMVLTFATIIFSEILPKSLGAHYAPLISRVAAPVILVLIYLLYPVVVALDWLANLMKSGRRPIGTEEQIRSLVTIGRRAGYIESDEGQLIHRAFVLNDRTAADVMTPLKKLVSVDATTTVRQAAERVLRNPYSRYPVFGQSIHQVQGMLLSRDILEAMTQGQDNQPITGMVRPTLIVPANMRSDQLLVIFRDRRIHLAVVQDQGKTVGLVTLEDVLEELVGEIEDETDLRSEPVDSDSS